jgi:hypothetical protein
MTVIMNTCWLSLTSPLLVLLLFLRLTSSQTCGEEEIKGVLEPIVGNILWLRREGPGCVYQLAGESRYFLKVNLV